MAREVETFDKAVTVSRFSDPEPQRRIGLIWRKTSPLTRHYRELGRMITQQAGFPCDQDHAG